MGVIFRNAVWIKHMNSLCMFLMILLIFKMTLVIYLLFKMTAAEVEMYQKNKTNTMAADALDLCLSSSSAAMLLTMWGFPRERLHLRKLCVE